MQGFRGTYLPNPEHRNGRNRQAKLGKSSHLNSFSILEDVLNIEGTYIERERISFNPRRGDWSGRTERLRQKVLTGEKFVSLFSGGENVRDPFDPAKRLPVTPSKFFDLLSKENHRRFVQARIRPWFR